MKYLIIISLLLSVGCTSITINGEAYIRLNNGSTVKMSNSLIVFIPLEKFTSSRDSLIAIVEEEVLIVESKIDSLESSGIDIENEYHRAKSELDGAKQRYKQNNYYNVGIILPENWESDFHRKYPKYEVEYEQAWSKYSYYSAQVSTLKKSLSIYDNPEALLFLSVKDAIIQKGAIEYRTGSDGLINIKLPSTNYVAYTEFALGGNNYYWYVQIDPESVNSFQLSNHNLSDSNDNFNVSRLQYFQELSARINSL